MEDKKNIEIEMEHFEERAVTDLKELFWEPVKRFFFYGKIWYNKKKWKEKVKRE